MTDHASIAARNGAMAVEANTILYASDDSEASIAEAREYIARMGFTSEHVRLIRKDGQVLVIAKTRQWE
jgi:predicted O-methyltransferase YrrM